MKNKKSNLYTFIMEYKGGTYISQVNATTLTAGVLKWAEKLEISEIKYLGEKTKKEIIGLIIALDASDKPVLLNGLCNAWHFDLLFSKGFLLVNVIKTDATQED